MAFSDWCNYVHQQDILDGICREQYTNLNVDKVIMVQQQLEKFIRDYDGVLTVGTGCSGSDLIMTILKCLKTYWKTVWDLDLRIEHKFSVEKEPYKQQFILQHHRPQHLFGDVTTLADGAPQVEIKTGAEVEVPDVSLWASDFECDNWSGLSSEFRSGQTVGCVGQNSGKSGKTCIGCMTYIVKYRPRMVLLENVKNLMGGQVSDKMSVDLHKVIETLNEAGYVAHFEILSSLAYGCAQHRDRLYLFAVLVSPETVPQLEEDVCMPACMRQLPLLLRGFRIPCRPIESFLLPCEHTSVEGWQEAQRANKRADKQVKVDAKYEADHLLAYREMSLTWPPDFKEDPSFLDRADYLCNRQLEVAWYIARQYEQRGTKVETTRDLNMSLSWQQDKTSLDAHCLVSTSRPWLLLRQRSMCGAEALTLQGFPESYLKSYPTSFTDPQLLDLAGNAFNGFVLLAAISAFFGTCDLSAAIAVHESFLPAPTDNEVEVSDEDEDGSAPAGSSLAGSSVADLSTQSEDE